MTTAKLFKHGGSQAVRLPKAFRFPGTEILIEKMGDAVVLRPKLRPALKSLGEVARYMAKLHPRGVDFPGREQPADHQKRDLTW